MSAVEALHFNCVACRAASSEETAETATLVMLVIVHDDLTAEEIHRDLCFAHRRRVEDATRKAQAERRGGPPSSEEPK
jgi:hypothetical protein